MTPALTTLALGTALLLSACNQITGSDGADGSGGDPDEPVTLRLTSGAGPEQDAIEALIEEYESQHQNITIEATFAPVDQLQTSLRTRLGAGNAPDVFITFPGGGSALSIRELAEADLLADLSGEEWSDRIPESFRSTTGVNGETLMLPLSQGVIGTFHNSGVLDSAGVAPPETWSDVLAACETLAAAGVVPYALGVSDSWAGQLISYAAVASTVYAQQPDFATTMAEGDTSFADSGWRDALEKYDTMNTNGCFNENPNGTSADEALRMVASGDAAMTVMVHGTLPTIQSYNPDGEFGMAPFPAVDDADDVWIPAAAGTGYSVSADTAHPDEARAFLAYLAQPDNNAQYAEATAFISLLSGVDAETPPELATILTYVENGRSTPYMDQNWPNAELQPAHLAGIQNLLAGETTVPQLLETLDSTYRSTSS